MFTKSTIALAIIVGATSGATAAMKGKLHVPPHFGVYDSQGNYLGAGPEPHINPASRDQAPNSQGAWDEYGKRWD